jgi:hypothetical protein
MVRWAYTDPHAPSCKLAVEQRALRDGRHWILTADFPGWAAPSMLPDERREAGADRSRKHPGTLTHGMKRVERGSAPGLVKPGAI